MSSAEAVPSPATETAAPVTESILFYQRPEALTPEHHGKLHLKKDGDFNFAKATNSVAITATEFVAAMRSYPIVFAAGAPYPLAVLGLEQNNLFVDDSGQWSIGHYVPAYIRRYPFAFIAHPDGERFVLGIDRASTLLEKEGEGPALFESGKPSDVTQKALAFCGAFQTDHAVTTSFGQALETAQVLMHNQAQAKLPDGRQMSLSGFRIVDRRKFASLPSDTIVDWHRRGWLALVHYHLASLDRFTGLLERTNGDGTGI
jgi:SapC.